MSQWLLIPCCCFILLAATSGWACPEGYVCAGGFDCTQEDSGEFCIPEGRPGGSGTPTILDPPATTTHHAPAISINPPTGDCEAGAGGRCIGTTQDDPDAGNPCIITDPVESSAYPARPETGVCCDALGPEGECIILDPADATAGGGVEAPCDGLGPNGECIHLGPRDPEAGGASARVPSSRPGTVRDRSAPPVPKTSNDVREAERLRRESEYRSSVGGGYERVMPAYPGTTKERDSLQITDQIQRLKAIREQNTDLRQQGQDPGSATFDVGQGGEQVRQQQRGGGDDPGDSPPPDPVGETLESVDCGDDPVARIRVTRGSGAMDESVYLRRPGRVTEGDIIRLPPGVARRERVEFKGRLKDRSLREHFYWIQFVRGYVWGGEVEGGHYEGVGNQGQYADRFDHRGNLISRARRVTNRNWTIPDAPRPVDQRPPVSEWAYDDLHSVGHFTTHRVGKDVTMRDRPGLDEIGLRPDGRNFFEADFEFRSYLVCPGPETEKKAYGRCTWETKLTVDAFRVRRTASAPRCEKWWPPRDLLAGGDQDLTNPASTPRVQDVFDAPEGWQLHEDED